MSAAAAATQALPETHTACWGPSDWPPAKQAHWAAASLMEIGGLNSRGQKSAGMLRNNVREMLEAVLVATADGSLTAIDPAEADRLLPPGQESDKPLNNPHE